MQWQARSASHYAHAATVVNNGMVALGDSESWLGDYNFGTFTVNLLGCLVIGALAALVDTRGILTGTSRAVIFIGVLGGFTTFSSFGYETLQLVKGGQMLAAGSFVVMQFALCLPAVWLGDLAVRAFWGR